jgi:urea transporter
MPRRPYLPYARGSPLPGARNRARLIRATPDMHTATHIESAALRTLLRSLGQIVLQPNAVTGACVLAALFLCDIRLACAALTGAIAANVSAVLAGYDEHDTQLGLHGFNGALAALAAFTFIADNATATAVAILAATATAWLLEPWSRWLRNRGQGFYSSPCLIVTWIWLPSVRLAEKAPPPTTHDALPFMQALDSVFAGLAQITFAHGALSGLLVLAGITASSRRYALWALVGTIVASGGYWLAGASSSSLEAGLPGFNGALTALAVADCGVVIALGAIALSVMLQQFAGYGGWPSMTAPFVIATWSAHWLARRRAQNVCADVAAATSGTQPGPLAATTRQKSRRTI